MVKIGRKNKITTPSLKMEKTMKKYFILVALLIVPFICFAEGANWDNDLGGFNGIRDYVGQHDGHYYRENPIGIGADLVVWKSDSKWIDEVVVESRMDLANEEFSTFAVARIDVFSWFKK